MKLILIIAILTIIVLASVAMDIKKAITEESTETGPNRTRLIHLFGGLTKEEDIDFQRQAAEIAEFDILFNLKHFADQMNGLPADEWCQLMYNHICGSMKRKENEL